MATTLKYTINKSNMRSDGSWNVVVRVTHNRRVKYIPTTEYVTKKDITPSGKIKNVRIAEKMDELVLLYRKKLSGLNLEVNEMGVDAIVDYLKRKNDDGGLSFTAYAEKWMRESKVKGVKNYQSALNALRRYFGRGSILFSEVTANALRGFCDSLEGKERAASLYCNAIVKIFNDAREYYNDEDNGIMRIKHTLSKFKPPRQNVAKKRALTLDEIRHLFSLPYDGVRIKGMQSRHDLALDCFRLSFCLMGMNSADLYTADIYEDGEIVYHRQKTKDRRSDGAEMHVVVPECVRELFDRRRDTSGERVFDFHLRFSTPESFNRAINLGLKEIGRKIGVPDLQYYAARHSMATIAVNEAGINKYLVNDMLCHTDPTMKVTELYIKKDFRPINEANERLMKFVFSVREN